MRKDEASGSQPAPWADSASEEVRLAAQDWQPTFVPVIRRLNAGRAANLGMACKFVLVSFLYLRIILAHFSFRA